MLKDIKSTAKHSFIYAIGNMGVKVVGFILLPFYTNPNLLSTSDYGAMAVLEATMNMLIVMLSFSMSAGISRWYWDKEYKNDQKSIFFTSLFFLLIVLSPSIVALVLFAPVFSQLIFSSSNYIVVLQLTIVTAGIQIVNNLTLTLIRLNSKSLLNVIVQITKFVSLLFLIIWELKYKQAGLLGVWRSFLIVELLSLLILVPIIIKNCQLKFQYAVLKSMLKYGLPLMLASISGVLLAVTDRYMLNSLKGLSDTAIYSVGLRMANTLKVLISSSLTLALLPLQMKKIGTEGNQMFYAKIMKYSSFIFSVSLLFLSLFSLEILKVITGSSVYWEAHKIVAIISFALLFGQLKNNAIIGITIKKKTKITGLLLFVTSLINILLNSIFIPLFDIVGAALATLCSQMFFFVAIYKSSQKIYHIPYEMKKILIQLIILAIFVFIGLILTELTLGIRLGLKMILFVTFPFVLRFFNFYDEIELKRIADLFNAWNRPRKLSENFKRFLN